MKLIEIDHNPSSRQLHVFGFIWLLFFAIIGGVLLYRGSSVLVATLVSGIAVMVPAVGWLVPGFMRFVYIGMAYAAFPIGFVVSYLIMVVVYYLVLTPIGLLVRLCGYDPMNRHFDGSADTYWCPREHDDSLDTYFRQF
jgi:ABC-type uncharacterized transport system permease subunit